MRNNPDRYDVFPSYKGGRTYLSTNGYIMESAGGESVGQHRLIAEDKLGRPLIQSDDPNICEVVHHKDECPTNNHPDNLQVMTRQEHIELHGRLNAERARARLTQEDVESALDGRSIHQAARLLKVDSDSLRAWFPDLMATRKRQIPEKLDDAALVEKIRPLALCPLLGHAEAAKALGIGRSSLIRLIERYSIPWKSQTRAGVYRVRLDENDAKMVSLRRMAADPNFGLNDIEAKLGFCPRTIQRLLKTYEIPWTGKSTGVKGKRSVYGGKPTRRVLAAYAGATEPDLL